MQLLQSRPLDILQPPCHPFRKWNCLKGKSDRAFFTLKLGKLKSIKTSISPFIIYVIDSLVGKAYLISRLICFLRKFSNKITISSPTYRSHSSFDSSPLHKSYNIIKCRHASGASTAPGTIILVEPPELGAGLLLVEIRDAFPLEPHEFPVGVVV